jgi:hypothetical protein
MLRSTMLSLVLGLAVSPLAACDSHEAKATPTTPSAKPVEAAQPPSTDHQALCVQMFTRARTCTDTYIPALVDSRAKLDVPKGIADKVKADRAAVIAEAKQEWAEDSKDDKIAATCQHILASMPSPDPAMTDTVKGCLAQADCAGYTTCITPVFEKHLAK